METIAAKAATDLAGQGTAWTVVVLLGCALVGMFLLLQRSQKDVRDLTREIATLAAETLAANREVANALDRMTATGDGRTRALEEVTKEIDRLGHDTRHGLAQPMAALTGLVEQQRNLVTEVRDALRALSSGRGQ